ncbi:hypothetical protein BP5796_02885 [Coleophoma crateriformis]|uniref:DUF7580 domain-containing protein n=1 Tax=Coleophoma crateriformis TaxID=565419 RepID=A0A3D8SZL5_9HELO|nr:hypothetical protein BP5796_02885 [Coleophoma crateriformis]
MILGLELAFVIAPLVVTATEYHRKAYNKLKLIASPKANDEELEDFLADLHDEISLLLHTLRCLISDLTTLTETQRERLLSLDREQWKKDDVSIALHTRLGGDAEIAFTDILQRLLKSLNEVVSERSFRFIRSDISSSPNLFKKLEGFREDMMNGATIHDLRSRFQFTTKEGLRTKNLRRIAKCNKKLERFVHGNPAGIIEGAKKNSLRKAQPPTNRSRRMSLDAHKRIARNWSCTCPSPHEARLGLLKCLMNSETADSAIKIDLLVSMTNADDAKEIWLGSRIRMILEDWEDPISEQRVGEGASSQSIVRFMDEKDVVEHKAGSKVPHRYIDTEPFCTLIKEAHKHNHNLELVFDGEKLWQARSSGSHVIPKPVTGIPLRNLLGDSQSRLSLKQRRALAVVLSHAILHYCESPWVSDNWNKEHVNFFATSKGPDLMRPYLATQFEQVLSAVPKDTSDLYSHPSPALLSLGILLLELYLSKPIESLWDAEDMENGMESVNTNWITAEKQLDLLGDDLYEGYRDAIQACLRVDYVGVEDNLTLEDEGFRKLIYDRVVRPLEDELENGFHVTPEDLGVL